MKHPDWAAFVAAIVAEPDDDTVRLVAADFLDENGDPRRAAFIRIQIELARLEASGLGQSPEAGALRKKELAFLGPLAASARWAAEDCPELVHGTPTQAGVLALRRDRTARLTWRGEPVERLTWRRGFVEWVACPAAEWLGYGDAVRARNPVRRVILSACEQVAGEVWEAGLDAIRGLRRVDLTYAVTGAVRTVAQGLELAAWLRERVPGTPVNMELPPGR